MGNYEREQEPPIGTSNHQPTSIQKRDITIEQLRQVIVHMVSNMQNAEYLKRIESLVQYLYLKADN